MEKLPPKPRKVKGATREELLQLDKNELVDKIIQLEAHNFQLRNIISKKVSEGFTSEKVNENKRPFDFAECHYRRVLLRIIYFGWDYHGLAVQEDSNQTIEHHLFHALTKTCLIQNRETSQYHRCGRTDKGVSAFGQVISISLRSKYPPGQQNSPEAIQSELPYCKILNRLLPKEIRAVTWMPVPTDKPEYSARFDCKKRQYKYYFPRSNLRIDAMREAASYLVGNHDFRNLCKMDVGNGVTEFRRTVMAVDIQSLGGESDDPTSMYCLVIAGNAFLWHQIRCIMAILLLVGQSQESPDVVKKLLDVEAHPRSTTLSVLLGKLAGAVGGFGLHSPRWHQIRCIMAILLLVELSQESPDVMKKLLDVEAHPRKPQYTMALDVPLNLFHCTYDLEDEQKWHFDPWELRSIITTLQHEWTLYSVKTTMIKDALQTLESEYAKLSEDKIASYTLCLHQGVTPRLYKPLFERDTCQSLEEMIEFYKKKRKIPNLV